MILLHCQRRAELRDLSSRRADGRVAEATKRNPFRVPKLKWKLPRWAGTVQAQAWRSAACSGLLPLGSGRRPDRRPLLLPPAPALQDLATRRSSTACSSQSRYCRWSPIGRRSRGLTTSARRGSGSPPQARARRTATRRRTWSEVQQTLNGSCRSPSTTSGPACWRRAVVGDDDLNVSIRAAGR